MTFGQKLKKLRTEKGLTQKDLADQMHVTFQTISKWESDTNEPDFNSLKELSKILDCSIEYLVNDESELEKKEETPVATSNTPSSGHLCTRCGKPIAEKDLAINRVAHVHHRSRGRSTTTYSESFYHQRCLEEYNAEQEKIKREQALAKFKRNRKITLGWSIAAGAIGLAIGLVIFLAIPYMRENVHIALAILYSVLISYVLFADMYCILAGSYVADVFLGVASWTIKFPGLIFSWDLGGLVWLIWMKVLFAVLGFLLTVALFLLAIGLSGALAAVSFPFIFVKTTKNRYIDCVFA